MDAPLWCLVAKEEQRHAKRKRESLVRTNTLLQADLSDAVVTIVPMIGAAMKMVTNSANSPGIGINGLGTFALKFEQSQVTFLEFLKSFSFCWFHGILLFYKCPKLDR